MKQVSSYLDHQPCLPIFIDKNSHVLIYHCIFGLHFLARESFHKSWEKFEGHLIEYPWCLNLLCKVSSEIDKASVKAKFKPTFWWLIMAQVSVKTNQIRSRLPNFGQSSTEKKYCCFDLREVSSETRSRLHNLAQNCSGVEFAKLVLEIKRH